MIQRPPALETVSVDVPDHALEAYEAALSSVSASVGFFRDDATGTWRVEGVKQIGIGEPELAAALALAEMMTGISAIPRHIPTAAGGWLARTQTAFPEQRVGRRFVIRGTHLPDRTMSGLIALTLDAGVAFGSGEHGSTRGCLRALERIAYRCPRRILDLGTGSGILAIAAARLLRRRVLATDIEPWSIRVAAENAAANGVARLVHCHLADGWRDPVVTCAAPFDLVLANILARPLAGMAKHLAARLATGGRAVLAGLLGEQVRLVLAAHRRHGMALDFALHEGNWTTLVLRAPARDRTRKKPSPACGRGQGEDACR